MRLLTLIVLVVSLLFSGTAPTRADHTFVTGDDYPPFSGTTLPNGGLITDLVRTIFADVDNGEAYHFDFVPWTRGFEFSKRGTYIGTFPYVWSTERAADFLFSHPIVQGDQKFFVLKNSSLSFDRDEDLMGARICMPRGYDVSPLQRLVDLGYVVLDHPSSLTDCFNMLAAGRTHMVAVIDIVGRYLIQNSAKLSMDQFKVLEPPLGSSPHYLIVSKARDDALQIIDTFNAGLAELRASGEYDRILARHLD